MPAPTQGDRKTETPARLIAAPAGLFARKGVPALSAEAGGEAAGRTTRALYNHFGGKDALLLALVEQWLSESAARILAGVEDSPDLDGRLRALWSDSVAAQQADSELWLLLEFELWLHGARNAEFADRLAARYDDRRRNLAAPLKAWANDVGLGQLRHPERTAGLVIALLLGTAMQQRLDPNAFSPAEVVAGLRSILEGDVT